MKIRNLIIAAFLIGVIPIFINILCVNDALFPVVGNGTDWLAFWGSYLGGVTTVLATVFVFYKSRSSEVTRKDYEIQIVYFNCLCEDMSKLCSAIDIDMLSFYIMELRDIPNFNVTMNNIGAFEKQIKITYNEFCLKYAHQGGKEKDELISKYYGYANEISELVSSLQNAIVSLKMRDISIDEYNKRIHLVCRKFEEMEDPTLNLYKCANSWKKKEWEFLERLRLQYVNG